MNDAGRAGTGRIRDVSWGLVRPFALVITTACCLLLVGCQGAESTVGPTSLPAATPVSTTVAGESPGIEVTPAPADATEVAAARSAIDAADLTDEATLEAVYDVRVTDAGVEAAAQAIRGGASGDALWAATWIYSGHGTEAAVLLPLLSDADPTIRSMAATTLLAWGRAEAFQVLVDLVGQDGNVRGSEPPLGLSDFARGALDQHVERPPTDLEATPPDAAVAWQTWLAANETALKFDPTTGRWSAP
jgi:hypothetical protein